MVRWFRLGYQPRLSADLLFYCTATSIVGQAVGSAMADLLFGDVSPSGKLAETFPMALSDCPSQPHFAAHPRQALLSIKYKVGSRISRPIRVRLAH